MEKRRRQDQNEGGEQEQRIAQDTDADAERVAAKNRLADDAAARGVGGVYNLRADGSPVVAAQGDDVPPAAPLDPADPVRDGDVPAHHPVDKGQNVPFPKPRVECFPRLFSGRDKFEKNKTPRGDLPDRIRLDVGPGVFLHRRGHDDPRAVPKQPARRKGMDRQHGGDHAEHENEDKVKVYQSLGDYTPIFCVSHRFRTLCEAVPPL